MKYKMILKQVIVVLTVVTMMVSLFAGCVEPPVGSTAAPDGTSTPSVPTEVTNPTAPSKPDDGEDPSTPTEPSDVTDPTKPSEPDAPHEHRYAEVVVPADCETGGYTEHTCECGESYRDNETKPLGHKYGEWHEVKAASCSADGAEERKCDVCGKKESRSIAKLEHTWTDWKVTKEPTTEATGEKTRSCKKCGAKDTQKIDKHQHSFTETVVDPTCEEDGYTLHKCECGTSYQTDIIEKFGHDWSEWDVTQEPTLESVGERKRTCSRCKEVWTEALPKLDPETGEKQENYIDPRVEYDHSGSSPRYRYNDISVIDRRTWGDAPSIQVNDDGSLTVVYYQQGGEKVEVLVEVPPNTYVRRLIIRDDGTYKLSLIGDPS